LISALQRAMQGDSVVAPEMMSKLVAAYRGAATDASSGANAYPVEPVATATTYHSAIASLSPRELDVLRGIVRGASNKEIARDHGIAETTVKIHVQHVLRKLEVSSRVHAAVIASENGIL